MRYVLIAMIAGLVGANVFASSTTGGALLDSPAKESSVQNVLYLEKLPSFGDVSGSAISFRAGKITFNNLEFRNDYAAFSYAGGEAPSFGLGFEVVPVRFLGTWGGFVNLDYAYYKGTISSREAKNSGRSYVNLLPISAGFVYAAEFHPAMRWFSPSVSVGASYNVIFQGGELDHFHARGGNWTLKRSLGIRHSLSWAGLKSTQLLADVVVHSPVSSGPEDSTRFVSKTVSLGLISAL